MQTSCSLLPAGTFRIALILSWLAATRRFAPRNDVSKSHIHRMARFHGQTRVSASLVHKTPCFHGQPNASRHLSSRSGDSSASASATSSISHVASQLSCCRRLLPCKNPPGCLLTARDLSTPPPNPTKATDTQPLSRPCQRILPLTFSWPRNPFRTPFEIPVTNLVRNLVQNHEKFCHFICPFKRTTLICKGRAKFPKHQRILSFFSNLIFTKNGWDTSSLPQDYLLIIKISRRSSI